MLHDGKQNFERHEASFIPLQGGEFFHMAQQMTDGSPESAPIPFSLGHQESPYEESRVSTRQTRMATSRHLARTSVGVRLSAIERTSQKMRSMRMTSTTIPSPTQ